MAAHAPAPTKVFREPAQTESVQCPCCGGPITLKGFGGVEQVACPYCGSELAPEDSGALSVMRQIQRQQRQSMIGLHTRGTLEGHEWEIIGIVWRECNVDGVTYPWQEFLLYNPYRGYRWLVYQMSDGHWSIGGALRGAPKAGGSAHRSVEFQKEHFRHFQTVMATVSYVEGEFPWQVHVGDNAVAHEYIKPPGGISIEESQMPDGSAGVNFTEMRHIDGADVWKAFGLQGSPPSTSGVGSVAPNPYKARARFVWVAFAGLLVALIATSVLYIGGRTNKVVYDGSGLDPAAPVTQEITIGEDGDKTTLEVEFSAVGLSNQWAYVDVMLVNTKAEEAVGFGVTAEEWHGVSGGESWREGSARESVTLGGVKGGTYVLQITPSTGDASGKPQAAPAVKLNLKIKENVVLVRYIMIAFFVILGFPILNALLGMFFEGKRWRNSDYAPG